MKRLLVFTVFALRRPLTEDTAWYALRLEAGATDAPLPERLEQLLCDLIVAHLKEQDRLYHNEKPI